MQIDDANNGLNSGSKELKVDCRNKILSSVQCNAALRVAPAYRTASKSTILVISGVILIGIGKQVEKSVED